MDMNHSQMMEKALNEAEKAGQKDEVPIGAVIVSETGLILSAAHNRTIQLCDPTAHAEILALREAAQKMQNYRLLNTSLYVTIEPCIMCMGAIVHSRVSKVVFGANDLKWGAGGSLYNFSTDTRLNHQLEIISGVCENECRTLVQNFFRAKRKILL
ncbi:MAG: tRNA adenosine(34) deaminase TadA [Desulfobacteraceae bacterium]|nr:tRNA adenosine(34) deaminase TadA [Desulfobacteraceae bacterium]